MRTADKIGELAGKRIGRILDVAEAAIPPDRFAAFRRVVLQEFGSGGFVADLNRLLGADGLSTERNGTGRNEVGGKGGAR